MTDARELYLPSGFTKQADDQSDAVAYLFFNANGQPTMKVFFGKQSKPVAYFRYSNEAARAEAIQKYFQDRRSVMAYKKARKDERKEFVHSYVVGDVFRASWGYDQTNVNCFEVVAVKGKHLIVREINQESGEGRLTDTVFPMVGDFKKNAKEIRCLAQKGHIKVDHLHASYCEYKLVCGVKIFDGTYFSSYA